MRSSLESQEGSTRGGTGLGRGVCRSIRLCGGSGVFGGSWRVGGMVPEEGLCNLKAKLKGMMGGVRQGSEKQEESWAIVTSWKPRGENFKKSVWQPSYCSCRRPVSCGACLLCARHGAERPYTVVPSVLAGVPGKAATVTSEGWMTRALVCSGDRWRFT